MNTDQNEEEIQENPGSETFESPPEKIGETNEEPESATSTTKNETSNQGNSVPYEVRKIVVSVPSKPTPTYLTVEVFNICSRKPFLGGFRPRKRPEIEYHNASAQTWKKTHKEKYDNTGRVLQKFHRDTQTIKHKTRSAQTYREQGTQMAKIGLEIDNSRDRIVELKEEDTYFSAEEYTQLVVRNVVRIQSFFRGFLARKRARKLREEFMEKKRRGEERIAMEKKKELARKQSEMHRRKYPKTKNDFAVLYRDLDNWKLKNTEKIREKSKSKEELRARLYENVRKEAKIIQMIDRLKIKSDKENEIDRINRKLQFLARPKQVKNDKGEIIEIETPLTVRSRELMDLYHGLNTEMLSIDERLDVLLHVKWTVKEFDCQLTRDIVELIDREADLLNRGRKNKSVKGLRKRLANLFLQFIECPEFNPVTKKLKSKQGGVRFKNTLPLAQRTKKRYY